MILVTLKNIIYEIYTITLVYHFSKKKTGLVRVGFSFNDNS